jgi:hypothetical protein
MLWRAVLIISTRISGNPSIRRTVAMQNSGVKCSGPAPLSGLYVPNEIQWTVPFTLSRERLEPDHRNPQGLSDAAGGAVRTDHVVGADSFFSPLDPRITRNPGIFWCWRGCGSVQLVCVARVRPEVRGETPR